MKRLLAIISLLGFGLGTSQMAWADEGVVAVSALAERSIDPNFLQVDVEIWSQANTAKQAQQLAAQQYKEVQKALGNQGIKKEDVQTEQYSLNPNYEYNERLRKNQLTGYRSSQVLQITLRKIESAGSFLDAISAGSKNAGVGVNIQNLQWGSDKKAELQDQLLTEAVKSARAQAEVLAKASGTSIRSVKRLQPILDRGQGPQPMMKYAMAEAAMDGGTNLSTKKIKVVVEVSAEYSLK